MALSVSHLLRLLAGPLAFALVGYLLPIAPGQPTVAPMLGLTLWMAIWWMTEALPLAVTALLPVIVLPLTGLMEMKAVASAYTDQVIFLFIGGFLLALALEHWELHRRIALRIILAVGCTPARILLGFMLASYLLSMWVSNTATTMMLFPAVLAVVAQLEKHYGPAASRLSTGLLLGLAYASSIGGLTTLVGTPTNMIFAGYYQDALPGTSITFLQWLLLGLPISLLLFAGTYVLLQLRFARNEQLPGVNLRMFEEQYAALGRLSYEEKVLSIVFGLTAFLWIFRADLELGAVRVPGWSNLFPNPAYILDSTVAVLMAGLLFLLPSRTVPGRMIMTWKEAEHLPFDTILLFGGGFALAKGVESSGMAAWLGDYFSHLQGLPPFLMVVAVCTFVTILSEFASNVASIQLMLPILLVLSKEMGQHPLLLLLPATLAASLGFMLPVATAPNTIVYGSGRVKSRAMATSGLALNLMGVLLVAVLTHFLAPLVFDLR